MEYSVDTITNYGNYDRLYQVASEQKIDINTLIKLDAVMWGQLLPSVTIEQRLYKDLVIEPNLQLSSFKWGLKDGLNFSLTPNLDLKYYFNRNHRNKKGKKTIGFSADYFLVGFSYTITDDQDFFDYTLDNKHVDYTGAFNNDYYSYYSWRIMYGLQRRIRNIGYADFAIGGERFYFKEYGISRILPTVHIKIGFALSPNQFKRLNR